MSDTVTRPSPEEATTSGSVTRATPEEATTSGTIAHRDRHVGLKIAVALTGAIIAGLIVWQVNQSIDVGAPARAPAAEVRDAVPNTSALQLERWSASDRLQGMDRAEVQRFRNGVSVPDGNPAVDRSSAASPLIGPR